MTNSGSTAPTSRASWWRTKSTVELLTIKVDPSVTELKYKFAEKHNLPLYYTSSADGTNVVKVFEDTLKAAVEYKNNPKDKFMEDVMDFLKG